MALSDGQIEVRGLVLGPGTDYIVTAFNPFRRQARAGQVGERAWGHGGWSGAEWSDERVVPITLDVGDDQGDASTWMAADQALAAAFAPVETGGDVPLRFSWGGVEYLMFGRPRSVEPGSWTPGLRTSTTQVAFVALDPHIYSAELQTASTGLPAFEGGLTVPFTVPYTIDAKLVSGRMTVVNVGTAPVDPTIRIDGPVVSPRVTVQGPDGSVTSFTVEQTLQAGQWVEVDVAAGTVLLDGRPSASRRRVTVGRLPRLLPGVSTVRFAAVRPNDDAAVTVRWRSGWW